MKKAKILSIFGTRPEAIKMAPVIKKLEGKVVEHKVVVTAQHRELLDQVLKFFKIKPDYDLGVMMPEQTLTTISVDILNKLERILEYEKPDLVLIQGDTPTAFSAATAAFYQKIPIAHIEAGLRTYNKYDPFPEEMNRQLIDVLCDIYFAHTETAKDNLLRENHPKENIFVTGNTVIDALFLATEKERKFLDKSLNKVDFRKKVILVTTHRRENWGETIEKIHKAIKEVVDKNPDVEVIFPVHPNPKIKESANKVLGQNKRVYLVKPLDYPDMSALLKKVYFVMTDSGGLQEEAPALGKPVLVLRRTTERPEGVIAGTAKLIGVDPKKIVKEANILLKDKTVYQKMAKAINPYGDGKASGRIVKVILKKFNA
ncbi:MAG: UDP-N-acetylglucosamine 2-epimerase [Candidatus Woykebacteria bacterium RBG_13_40_15]|uniref:UDP-N-acetylglucosamine 2-epimerase (non-hydrolyzing) n=1 Tax=Candidatus Woykebacteria bacterium RBG_13_40_15 TaxID=1802593 RepID=A0A1G1W5D7_9BACT|nr:MAG: UDP-N-acetylglucosamine 2-epimerase [Candidatus Woykebacteria bacterium RBG_13_40_15]